MLPVLETKYDELLRPPHQEPGKHMEIHYFDHETIGGPYDPENPITEADLKKPGYIVIPRWEDFDHVKDVLRFAGYPMTEKLSPDLLSIVREEISAFLAGHGTAADCAGKIQSRTGIWLAERQ